MGLLERIEEDYRRAFKAHQADEVAVLRLLLSATKNAAIAARTSVAKTLDDSGVEQVIRQEVKKLKDALVDFSKAARADLVAATQAELATLAKYLPQAMSAEELQTIVTAVVERLRTEGVTDFGKVMGSVMREVKGRADGDSVAEAVKKALAQK